MKEIQLSKQGKNKNKYVVLVDDEDFEWLNKIRWRLLFGNDKIYACTGAHPNVILMHRIILGITDRNIFGDHKDGNGLNCQRNNLRAANGTQNNANSNLNLKNKTSKYRGVYWNVQMQKYRASIQCVKPIHLGYFDNQVNAAIAYNIAANKYFGEFAKINNI